MDFSEYSYSPNYHLYSFQAAPTSGFPSSHAMTGSSGRPSSNTSTGLTTQSVSTVVSLVTIKVINPSKENESKMFVLRNIELEHLSSPESMKEVIADQLATSEG